MTPTIGRLVHYRPSHEGAEVRPAIIVKVHNATCVNLHVFGGLIAGQDGVVEEQGAFPTSVVESPTAPRSWFWPPQE